MLSLSNIHYTIWEYNEEKEESSLVEAISIAGTRDDAWPELKARLDELATLDPDSLYELHTERPVNEEGCLKQNSYHGKVLN
jgi:hypothetical protein